MHKSKPKKFGYEEKVRGPRARKILDRPDAGRASRSDSGRSPGPAAGIIAGRNAVTEAIRSGRPVDRLLVQDTAGPSLGKVISLARENGIRVDSCGKEKLEELAGGEVHQGVIAFAAAHEYASLEDVFKRAEEEGEDPFIMILDGVQDPHNLGAILRSADCAGCHGVIVSKNHACGLTATVAKSSAGGIEYVPCVKVTNIARTVEELKEKGVWVYACDMDGEKCFDADLGGPVALVIGAEGKGVSRLVKERCDGVISIPLHGHIQSLNASCAASILMYEVSRRREK